MSEIRDQNPPDQIPVKIRHLEPGEWVHFPYIEVSNVVVSGSNWRVSVYPDGSENLIAPPAAVLNDMRAMAYANLVASDRHGVTSSEAKFIRKVLGQSFADFSTNVGIELERIKAIEAGAEISIEESFRIINFGRSALSNVLSSISDSFRAKYGAQLEFLQAKADMMLETYSITDSGEYQFAFG